MVDYENDFSKVNGIFGYIKFKIGLMFSSFLHLVILMALVKVASDMFSQLLIEVHKRSRGRRYVIITLSTFAKFYALSLLVMTEQSFG
jgi:hypothetical protein